MRYRTTIILIAVFLLGAAAGVGVARGYPRWRAHWSHKPKPRHDRKWFIQHMQKKLSLSPAQTQQFGAILVEASGLYHQLHETCKHHFLSLRHQERMKVRVMLQPAQLSKFNAWVAQMAQKHRKRRQAAPGH